MKSGKQMTLELMKQLPDDVSIQVIVDKLRYLALIEEGLRDVDAGRVVDHEDVVKDIDSRRASSGR